MYHVFLLIKDGFFHITNLALAKIEKGIKILGTVGLQFSWSHLIFDLIKMCLSFANLAIEKKDLGALKEVRYESLLSI